MINLGLVPSRLNLNLQNLPLNVSIQGENSEYNSLVSKISTSNITMYGGKYENIIKLDDDRVLFANTYEDVDIYKNLGMNDLLAIINLIFTKINIFKFEEDVSIFHLDKILSNTNNLVKISELPKMSIDYIISSNKEVILTSSKDSFSLKGEGLNVKSVSEMSIRQLLLKEIYNSLVIIKISNNYSVDIDCIVDKIKNYSSIIKIDKKNQLIAFKLNLIVDLAQEFSSCKKTNIIRDVISYDRTNWLSSALK